MNRRRVEGLEGKSFGMLHVLSKVPNTKPTKYNVICDCGVQKQVRGTSLTFAGTKSCGCSAVAWRVAKNRKDPGHAGRTKAIHVYKSNASSRGLAFDLTDDELITLFESACYYCGAINSNKMLPYDSHAMYCYNGVDRLDNSMGYVLGNVVACCCDCNRAKMSMSLKQFDAWLERAYFKLMQRRSVSSLG